MEVLEATDPYSRSLAADGARTQVVSRLARPFTMDVHITVEVCRMPCIWQTLVASVFWPGMPTPGELADLAPQIIDLSAPDLAPEGWADETSPPQGPFTDISVYELHIRDFSASDNTVPDHLKGKYLAFSLVRALLPAFCAYTQV